MSIDSVNIKSTINVLKNSKYFANLSKRNIKQFLAFTTQIQIKEGRTLITQGSSRNENFIIILDGILSIIKDGQEIAESSVGEIVGESSMLLNNKTSASVLAKTNVIALISSIREFKNILAINKKTKDKILQTSSSRVSA